jgi:hypothetical protein
MLPLAVQMPWVPLPWLLPLLKRKRATARCRRVLSLVACLHCDPLLVPRRRVPACLTSTLCQHHHECTRHDCDWRASFGLAHAHMVQKRTGATISTILNTTAQLLGAQFSPVRGGKDGGGCDMVCVSDFRCATPVDIYIHDGGRTQSGSRSMHRQTAWSILSAAKFETALASPSTILISSASECSWCAGKVF